jgi:hypothetical protein
MAEKSVCLLTMTRQSVFQPQLPEATQPCARLGTEAIVKERGAALSLKAVPAAGEMVMVMMREKEEDYQV